MAARRWAKRLMALGLAGAGASACGSDASQPPITIQADKCVIGLHGKGGTGVAPAQRDGYVQLSPTGNAEGWGGRQW